MATTSNSTAQLAVWSARLAFYRRGAAGSFMLVAVPVLAQTLNDLDVRGAAATSVRYQRKPAVRLEAELNALMARLMPF
jgi:hypothetical protein